MDDGWSHKKYSFLMNIGTYPRPGNHLRLRQGLPRHPGHQGEGHGLPLPLAERGRGANERDPPPGTAGSYHPPGRGAPAPADQGLPAVIPRGSKPPGSWQGQPPGQAHRTQARGGSQGGSPAAPWRTPPPVLLGPSSLNSVHKVDCLTGSDQRKPVSPRLQLVLRRFEWVAAG